MRRALAATVTATISLSVLLSCGESYTAANGGADASAGDASDAGTARIVFVSSAKSTGALGGVAGADARCSALAADAGLPGSFIAILGTANVVPGVRISGAGPFVRTDGKLVATSAADLFDGKLEAPIALDEAKASVPDDGVWTNALADGGSVGRGCNDFSSGSDEIRGATTGQTARVDNGWIESTGETQCQFSRRIYCVQQ